MTRREEQRQTEHPVGERRAEQRAGDLRDDVGGHGGPRDAALPRVGERHGGIEVRARHRAEREDQRDERAAGRERVRKQRRPTLPPHKRCAMIPEPTTAASKNAVPVNSATIARRFIE